MNDLSNGVRKFPVWLKASLAAVALSLGVLTIVTRDWIEVILGVDPDGGSGSIEWLIVTVFFATALLIARVAGWEWRHNALQASVGTRS